MYPLKFHPVYKQMLWGGSRLQTLYGRDIPGADTGESWDLACHRSGMSIISNGAFAGKTLDVLLATFGSFICGKKSCGGKFPLLFKLIDANDNLSVQVHPNDDNAERDKGESGKTEAWYVLAAEAGAELIYGLKEGVTRERFEELTRTGEVDGALRRVPVQVGDIISVPAGVVHALTSGVMVAEVQQSSDTTYRIFDYNRVDATGNARELHVDAALRVIDFGGQPSADFSPRSIVTPFFSMSEVIVDGIYRTRTEDSFIVYTVVEGSGEIIWTGDFEKRSEPIAAGETILVPAFLKEIALSGHLKVVEVR